MDDQVHFEFHYNLKPNRLFQKAVRPDRSAVWLNETHQGGIVKRVLFAILLAAAITGSAFAGQARIVLKTDLILDGAGNIVRDTNIVVEGSKIVGTDSGAGPVTYDLRGLTVLPGLIDTHIHLNGHFEEDGRAHGPDSDETAEELVLLFRGERLLHADGRLHDRPERRQCI